MNATSEPSQSPEGMDSAQEALLEMYRLNRAIGQPWFSIFALAYTFLIGTALGANTLVFLSVIQRKEAWAARNIFIMNLTLADLMLCGTMSLSAIDVLSKYWPFGQDSLLLCRTVKAAPCFAVYMASLTIVVIAFDRYWCIVHPDARQVSTAQAIFILPVIGLTSALMSTPVFSNAHLHVPSLMQDGGEEEAEEYPLDDKESEGPDVTIDYDIPWSDIVFCIEDWTTEGNVSTSMIHLGNQRHIYSIFSLVCQFGLPFVVISILYIRIYCYLRKNRIIRKEKISDRKRARRTNTILFIISLVFCVCWFPLNLLGVIIDSTDLFRENHQLMLCIFVACHLVGMSSACINPILYGYRNEGVRSEISHMIKRISFRTPTSRKRSQSKLLELQDLNHVAIKRNVSYFDEDCGQNADGRDSSLVTNQNSSDNDQISSASEVIDPQVHYSISKIAAKEGQSQSLSSLSIQHSTCISQCAGCADDVPETTTVNIATTEEPDLTTVIPVEDPTTIIPVEDPTTVIPVADSTTILPAGDSTTLVQINLTTTTESTRRLEITEINGRNELKSSLPRRNATARLEDCQDVKLLQEKLYFGRIIPRSQAHCPEIGSTFHPGLVTSAVAVTTSAVAEDTSAVAVDTFAVPLALFVAFDTTAVAVATSVVALTTGDDAFLAGPVLASPRSGPSAAPLPVICRLVSRRGLIAPSECWSFHVSANLPHFCRSSAASATEFVVVYEVIGNTTETSSILCASFDVIENHANFTCLTNFTQDLCNQTVKFKLETWVITGELFQPESEPVRINCNADFIQVFQKQSTDQVYQAMSHQIQSQLSSAEDDNDDILIGNIATGEGDNLEEMVELAPLVLNPKSVSCAWSSWSPWSKCPPRCGDTPGIRTRSRSQ
eukprot:maker-scaffold567_size135338-snap-gene-0.22 protein:Tk01951 transcript:maker-scaffold567_size135338-snap-gene-0.22-mRNA-1 annotation:"GK13031"